MQEDAECPRSQLRTRGAYFITANSQSSELPVWPGERNNASRLAEHRSSPVDECNNPACPYMQKHLAVMVVEYVYTIKSRDCGRRVCIKPSCRTFLLPTASPRKLPGSPLSSARLRGFGRRPKWQAAVPSVGFLKAGRSSLFWALQRKNADVWVPFRA